MMHSSFVRRPTVKEIIDLRKDKAIPAADFISQLDERGVHQARLDIDTQNQQDAPIVICACCHTPVKLRSSYKGNHYFQHFQTPLTSCPYQDGGGPDAKTLDTYRYNGLKEGDRHRQMKDLIENSLRADPHFQVEDRPKERVWQSSEDPGAYRRPDVRAAFRNQGEDLKIAFEVQLSSTYLHVIAERRLFYLQEHALLFWVFAEDQGINPHCCYEKDLFYNNNSNIFIIDEETCKLSCDSGMFMLRCRYLVPRLVDGRIEEGWSEQIIRFAELALEADKQRAWFYDTENVLIKAREELRLWQEQERSLAQEELRRQFEEFWISHELRNNNDNQLNYNNLKRLAADEGICLPSSYNEGGLGIVLNLLYSAKLGKVVGYKFNKFVEVAHKTAENYPQYMRYFAEVVASSKTKPLLREQDLSGKWAKRTESIWNQMQSNDPQLYPEMKHADLIRFLFPCCEGIIRRYSAGCIADINHG